MASGTGMGPGPGRAPVPAPASTPAWAAHLPAGDDPGSVDLLADGSLPAGWARTWARDPDRQLLWQDDGGWTTAGELEERTRRVAGRYTAAGLQPGDRLVLSALPSVDLVVAHVAALRLGLVVVPVNSAYGRREVSAIVADCRPAGAVVDDAHRADWVREAAAGPVVVAGPEVALPGGADPRLDAAAPGDPGLIVYTSGTTGAPKGALLSHGNLLASAEAVALAWRWRPEDRLVLALPLFHVHGLAVGLHGTLTAGASAVLRPAFDAGDVLDSIARHDASLWFGVPTMYTRLAATGRLAELRRLRLCVSGSAPLSEEQFAAVAGAGQRILERYGMTETLMNVSNPYDGERRPGTVGLPLPGVEVRLAAGTGEILLRGPNVFAGYWERPQATAEAFSEPGWFASGDIGALDDDGYLRIVGRSKELIISGGYNVYPREVEDVLRSHPGVADAAVIGLPDPTWGERVTAFVEAAGVTEAALLELAATQLAPYKRPRAVVFVDELPRNALGKVTRQVLRDR